MTITEADVREWLERQGEHYMENGEFTSDVLPGVTEWGIKWEAPVGLDRALLYERYVPQAVRFYCTWLGLDITVTPQQAPQR